MSARQNPSPASVLTWMLFMQIAGIAGVAAVAGGLWIWGYAEVWAESARRVPAGLWALRSLSVAAIALGQILFAWWVVPHLFARSGRLRNRRDLERGYFEQVLTLIAGMAMLFAVVCGLALAAAAGWGE